MMITHSDDDDDDDDTDRCGEEVGHEWHTHHWSKR
jgi:hypothetical protein